MTEELRVGLVLVRMLRQRPADEVAWRTMSGDISAARLAELIEARDETGEQWVSDHLRLTRDIVAVRIKDGPDDFTSMSGLESVLADVREISPLTPFVQLAREELNKVLWRRDTRTILGAELAMLVETGAREGFDWIRQMMALSQEMIDARGES